ncbi:MAG: glycosyltransferase [Pseudomonadota bacterium]
MTATNQIIGLLRFSYPSIGGFRKKHDTAEEAEAFLYDSARLARRIALFERFTLPCLKTQTDPDFTMLILVGETMPAPAQSRLADLVQDIPQVRILAYPSLPHYRAMRRAYDEVARSDATHRTTFRLDDDDAVDHDFIKRLRHWADKLADDVPTAIAFNKGLYVDYTQDPPEIFDATEKTPLAVGTALTVPMDHPENIYRRNHRILAQFYNTFSEAETPCYIRTVHQDNGSEPAFSGRTREMSDEEIAQVLETQFSLTPDELRQR